MKQPIDIVIAEDSMTQALELRYLLESRDYTVRVGRDGREALEHVTQRAPDMVISDIVMPNMDGYELCSAIRSNEAIRDLPVILLTALSDAGDVLKALECGADYFVTKPYREEFIINKIEQIIASRCAPAAGGGNTLIYDGQEHRIESDPLRVLNLLISTYENAVQQKKEVQQANDELQAAHRELKIKNNQLEQLNSEKNRFLGMAAHDLRNPITVIGGFCSLFLGGVLGEISAQQREIIERIKKSSTFMHQMLEDLLDVSQIEAGKLELRLTLMDLNELIENNVTLNRMFAEKKQISLQYVATGTPPRMNLDGPKMDQVFNNLISNAIKFSNPETAILVELKIAENEVLVTVRDQGQGIPGDEIEKVFKPFEKTSTRSTGGEKSTGLGMVIVKKIVESHQGRIWLESTLGVGTTFFVALPLPAPGN
jgi:signal transduction histidine kinase